MRFGAPHFLPWLLLVVVLAWLLWLYRRWQRHTLARWAAPRLLRRWAALPSTWRVGLGDACLCLGVACLLLALARPQWGTRPQELRERGLDLIAILDISPSMLTKDLPPSRWHQAVFSLDALTRQSGSDRVGLVAFHHEAGLQAPLTTDPVALRELAWHSRPGLLSSPGEGLADALALAAQQLHRRRHAASDRIVLVLSDGDPTHQAAALRQARRLRQAGIRLLILTLAPSDKSATRALCALAQAAQGTCWQWTEDGQVLAQLRATLDRFQRAERQRHQRRQPHERYPIPLALALLLLSLHRWLCP